MSARNGDAVIKAGALTHKVNLLSFSKDDATDDAKMVALVAAHVLQNLAFSKYRIVSIEAGAVSPLLALMNNGSGDAAMKKVAADILEEIADGIRDSATAARRSTSSELMDAEAYSDVRLILRQTTTGSVLNHAHIAEKSRKHIILPI